MVTIVRPNHLYPIFASLHAVMYDVVQKHSAETIPLAWAYAIPTERCWKHGYGDFIKAPEEFYLLFISRLEILWSLDLLDRDFFSRLWVEVSAHQSITNTMDTVEIKEFLYLFADEVLQELYPNTSEREVVQTGVKEAFGLLVREFIEKRLEELRG